MTGVIYVLIWPVRYRRQTGAYVAHLHAVQPRRYDGLDRVLTLTTPVYLL
jgi:hypothetical protein